MLRQARRAGSDIVGMMIESNLFEGSQPIPKELEHVGRLRYGVSVTDKCLGWDETERLLLHAAAG